MKGFCFSLGVSVPLVTVLLCFIFRLCVFIFSLRVPVFYFSIGELLSFTFR